MRTSPLLVLVLFLLVTGCRGRSGDDASKTGNDDKPPAVPAVEVVAEPVPCPECAGLGRSPHSGDDRPCFLCDGDGRCAICGGTGDGRDGPCSACGQSGRCQDCNGDGIISQAAFDLGGRVSPLPGECPVCVDSSGLCPDCGGEGTLPLGRQCVLCEGARWCPECRGRGAHPLCGGTGICPLCAGHGSLVRHRPADVPPPLRLHLAGGNVLVCRLLALPERALRVEFEKAGSTQREAFLLTELLPADVLLGFRHFVRLDDPDAHLAAARYVDRVGGDLLPAGRLDLAAARAAGAPEAEVDLLAARIDERMSARLLDRVKTLCESGDDPLLAWQLIQTHRHAFPGPEDRDRELTAQAAQVAALLGAAGSELEPEARERMAKAETQRQIRAVRRAEDWLARAQTLLARTGADVDSFLRAERAAREAWLQALRAADRAPANFDRRPAVGIGRRARTVRVRALIGLAGRLLESGHVERARSLAAVALGVDADDAGAARFIAEVEAAMGRRADLEEHR